MAEVHTTQGGWCSQCGGLGVAEHVERHVPGRLVGPSVIGSAEWRAAHCEKGDDTLNLARDIAIKTSGQRGDQLFVLAQQASVLAAIAAAHYAAANVRYRP